jgi:hypothetical protein
MIVYRRIATLRRTLDDASPVAEPRAEERANVLHVREVQGCVYLVEDVHRRRLNCSSAMMNDSAMSELYAI